MGSKERVMAKAGQEVSNVCFAAAEADAAAAAAQAPADAKSSSRQSRLLASALQDCGCNTAGSSRICPSVIDERCSRQQLKII